MKGARRLLAAVPSAKELLASGSFKYGNESSVSYWLAVC